MNWGLLLSPFHRGESRGTKGSTVSPRVHVQSDYKLARIDAWYFWTVVLAKILESPLDSKEIQPIHPKGNQSWIFIGRSNAEAETPIIWPPDAGKDWRQEKGMTEDEMVGWHHRLNTHKFEWTPGVGDGQGGLACCSPWGCKESDMTERLNWTELRINNELIAAHHLFFFFFWLCQKIYKILVPWAGIKPGPPALGARILNHWTTREVPHHPYYMPHTQCRSRFS